MKVFPCKDKKPLTANGLYDAKPYEQWLPQYEHHEEWGAPCGPDNGFWVVDVDAKHGGLDTMKAFDWACNAQVATRGGGLHLFYKWAEGCDAVRNNVGVLPGIDVRSQGGYVIVYGDVDVDTLKQAPAWLLALLSKPARKQAADYDGEVGEGGRNHFLAAAAGRMQRLGVLSLAALAELNTTKCSPPLDDYEVETIFNSVSRYSPASSPSEDKPPEEAIVWAHTLSTAMLDYLADKDLVKGLPTGLEELDELFGGGKRLGELTVTVAEAKTGKNTFWHFIQLDWLNKGIPIGYASRELSPEIEVLPNLLTLAMRRNLYKAADINPGAVDTILKRWKLAFTPGYGPIFLDELVKWMDECRKVGVQYFFIDHMHYCMADPEDFKGVSLFIREIKSYARRNNVHIDLIVQPKIQEIGQRLSLNSMRGGSSIGQALDNLLTMQRERDEEGKLTNVVKITMEVARSKLASLGSFYMAYDKDSMSFSVVEKVPDAPPETARFHDDVPVADRGRYGIKRLS